VRTPQWQCFGGPFTAFLSRSQLDDPLQNKDAYRKKTIDALVFLAFGGGLGVDYQKTKRGQLVPRRRGIDEVFNWLPPLRIVNRTLGKPSYVLRRSKFNCCPGANSSSSFRQAWFRHPISRICSAKWSMKLRSPTASESLSAGFSFGAAHSGAKKRGDIGDRCTVAKAK
jgi:hypothetical protein